MKSRQDNIGIGKLREKEKGAQAALDVKLLPSSPPPSPANHPSRAIPPKPDTHFPVSLSSLPSSFTTFLLSTVDSPAYANLTTSYLTRVFNPITPDDPRVRYFSIAGRVPGVSIWHPLWLPKMVMDGVERRTRQMLKEEWERGREPGVRIDGSTCGDADEKPLWARDDEWGNDGLVTVQSARWGEFLGTLEGCDHWTMRGARGIELNMDFHLRIARSGSGNGGEGWRFIDWGRFAGARKREEKNMADDGRGRVEKQVAEDASVKSSTDKLSAVFDWLVEQVPVPGKGKAGKEGELSEERTARKKYLDTKTDLEKVYVALSSKLYDEGL
jgi:triacylglycerol lipase